jgi:regulator of cell morphogenesis and NO signaling
VAERTPAPSDARTSYRSLLDRLRTLETDTHQHVHKENNILFPRAAALAETR